MTTSERRPRHPKPTKQQIAGRGIRHVARFMNDNEWVQGAFGNKKFGFCVLGALNYSIKDSSLNLLILSELNKWLDSKFNTSVMGFNDHPGQTKENVVATLARCADELDPGYRT